MASGLIDADLGGLVFKKRLAVPGRGKRGGARTLVVTNRGTRWFFVFGFEKNERANVSPQELDALNATAAMLLASTVEELNRAVNAKQLEEICHADH